MIVGDIRDRAKIAEAMRRFRPDVVFHAAAHKHVPLMEDNPDEAVLNNVGGTRNAGRGRPSRPGVERFVIISTDKAVNPHSMMGVTKSIAERVVRAVGCRGRARPGVRLGALRQRARAAAGSVVPIFQEQIRRGGPDHGHRTPT